MISNIKRYNNTIQGIVRDLKKISSYRNKGYRLDVHVYLDKGYYEHFFNISYEVSFDNFIYEESTKGNEIYIGLDLTNVHPKSYLDGDKELMVANYIVGAARKMTQSNPLYDEFIQDLKPLDKYSISYNSDFSSTSIYSKMMNILDDILENAKPNATLDSKDFPTLKNRNLLPVIIINLDKGIATYYDSNFPKSYRSDRVNIELSSIVNSGILKDLVRFPLGLIYLKVDHPHFRDRSIY